MLGNCYIRSPQVKGLTLDKGKICEALLFFDSVHVDLEMSSLQMFVDGGFYDEFVELLECGYLTANYCPKNFALMTNSYGGLLVNNFVSFKLAADANGKKFKNNRDILERDLIQIFPDRGSAKKEFKRISKLVSFKDSADDAICEITYNDIKDHAYCTEVARASLVDRGVDPGMIGNMRVSVVEVDSSRFVIDTNLNFEEINRSLFLSGDKVLSSKDLLPIAISARANLSASAKHNAALVGPENQVSISEMLIRKTIGENLDYKEKINQIYEFVDCNIPSVREVINSGERSTRDFMELYKKSFRFKEWIRTKSVNAEIVKELNLLQSDGFGYFSNKYKRARFGIFTAAGILVDLVMPTGLGTMAGIGVSALDQFAVDPIARRWSPHYFVSNDLKDFLN